MQTPNAAGSLSSRLSECFQKWIRHSLRHEEYRVLTRVLGFQTARERYMATSCRARERWKKSTCIAESFFIVERMQAKSWELK